MPLTKRPRSRCPASSIARSTGCSAGKPPGIALLRAAEADEGTVTFAFVCEGGAPDDWDLRPYLETALGAEGADRELERFAGAAQCGDKSGSLPKRQGLRR